MLILNLQGWQCLGNNAFDQKRQQYAVSPAMTRADVYSLWNRSSGSALVEPITDYDQPRCGDCYLLAKKSGQKPYLEPYMYKIAGKERVHDDDQRTNKAGQQVIVISLSICPVASFQNKSAPLHPVSNRLCQLVEPPVFILAIPTRLKLAKAFQDGNSEVLAAITEG